MIKITIKGPAGSGKTTVAEVLRDALNEQIRQGNLRPSKCILLEEESTVFDFDKPAAKAQLRGKHDVLIVVKKP